MTGGLGLGSLPRPEPVEAGEHPAPAASGQARPRCAGAAQALQSRRSIAARGEVQCFLMDSSEHAAPAPRSDAPCACHACARCTGSAPAVRDSSRYSAGRRCEARPPPLEARPSTEPSPVRLAVAPSQPLIESRAFRRAQRTPGSRATVTHSTYLRRSGSCPGFSTCAAVGDRVLVVKLAWSRGLPVPASSAASDLFERHEPGGGRSHAATSPTGKTFVALAFGPVLHPDDP